MDENRKVAANVEGSIAPKIPAPKSTPIDHVRVENPSEQEEELSKMAVQGVHEAVSEEIFMSYEASALPKKYEAVKHPGDIVEAGSLAAQSLPEAEYDLSSSIPKEAIAEGKLSDLQLEGILFACQRHQMILPNGNRAGFFIGDGAGVGKGRQIPGVSKTFHAKDGFSREVMCLSQRRRIAGLIYDNFVRGRTRSIWFSISSDLRIDAQRDLRDIGCYIKVIDGCQELDKETRVFGLPKDFKEGVVFSTYATLVSSVQKGFWYRTVSCMIDAEYFPPFQYFEERFYCIEDGPIGDGPSLNSTRQSRLKQLIDWCGGEKFEGCLIFDECHKAKHFLPGKEKSSTKVALAVTEIQRLLPKARVVYCSATGVTDVKNMAFMERLGLWGNGTAFKDFTPFLDSINRRGLGTLEMLAMEMKASGMYISRGLSYRQTEFMTVEANLTPAQVKVWNQAAHVWNELRRSLAIAVERTKTGTPRLWTQFWASHQRFFKQLCMSMKVPKIVEEAKEALEDGYCVVIGLQTTGEASLEQEISRRGGVINQFISLTREILRRFIQQFFPTDIHLNPRERKEDPWSAQAKNMLMSFVETVSLPNSPLDEIIDKLGGPSRVAEMTGRSGRIVRLTPQSEPHYECRIGTAGHTESLNVQERKQQDKIPTDLKKSCIAGSQDEIWRNSFMAGAKLVAIISDAASTGISLHADLRAKNQKRRIHITAELPWSADKAVQQLGRSHRSNQSSGPVYKLVTTNLGGERRFAAAVAKRLQSLGAITKGDRRAATAADLSQFNFDSIYGRQALRTMYTCIAQHIFFSGVMYSDVTEAAQTDSNYTLEEFHKIMTECLSKMDLVDHSVLGATVKQQEQNNVSKFLNRILGLTVEKQNLIFAYFYEGMKSLIRSAKRDGRYNEGVTDVKANSITMIGEPSVVFTEANITTNATKHVMLSVDRGLSWDEAVKKHESHNGQLDGFYCSKREQKGRRLYLLAVEKENAMNLYIIYRPNTGLSPFEETKDELLLKYKNIEPSEAERGWKEQYDKTEKKCIHGASCKAGPACSVGCRTTHLHLLCGGIISLLSVLEMTVNRYAEGLGLTRENRTLRVVRVELDNGKRLIGLKYPEPLICEVTRHLKEQQASTKDQIEYQVTKENQSAVVRNLKSKATTPPITLRNFFKVKKRESSDSDSDNASTKAEEIDSDDSEANTATEKADGLRTKTEVQKEAADQNSSCKSKFFSKSGSNSNIKNVKQTKTNGKRTSSGNSGFERNKRQKQSALKNSFQNNVKVKKATTNCPICRMEFESGTKNAEINIHIDQCLIE